MIYLRNSIGSAIALSLASILVLGMASFATVFWVLRAGQDALYRVSHVEEPLSAAAYEMEINVIGTGIGVLKYLGTGDLKYRARVDKDEADFWRFKQRYDELAGDGAQKELSQRVGSLYSRFINLGRRLMQDRDTFRRDVSQLGEVYKQANRRLLNVTASDQGASRVRQAAMQLNAAAGLLSLTDDSGDHGSLRANVAATLAALTAIGSSRSDSRWADLELTVADSLRTTDRLFVLRGRMSAQQHEFLEIRQQLGDELDEKVQALASTNLAESAALANAANSLALYLMIGFAIIFVSVTIMIGLFLWNAVRMPVRSLVTATEAVAEGNLSHRLAAVGHEEFRLLAHRFNAMLDTLVDTLVSRDRLEITKKDLQEMNIHLRDQIAERERVQAALELSQDQLRTLAAHLVTVREAERTRIAREIHDELGATLTAIKMDMGWYRDWMRKTREFPDDRAEDALMLIDHAIQSVKKVCSDLRPSVLDQLGLLPAIEWLAQDFQNRTQTPCEFQCDAPLDLQIDGDHVTALFRIVQEALTNVVRHAQATRVWIIVTLRGRQLDIEVADDGKGITVGSPLAPQSLGIVGMIERARMCGGDLKLVPRSPRGTCVRVSIVLTRAEQGVAVT